MALVVRVLESKDDQVALVNTLVADDVVAQFGNELRVVHNRQMEAHQHTHGELAALRQDVSVIKQAVTNMKPTYPPLPPLLDQYVHLEETEDAMVAELSEGRDVSVCELHGFGGVGNS